MGGLKMGELLIILIVVLVLFGGTRLPQLGSSLGQAIRNFKRGFNGDEASPEEKKSPGMMSEGSGSQQAQSDRASSKVS